MSEQTTTYLEGIDLSISETSNQTPEQIKAEMVQAMREALEEHEAAKAMEKAYEAGKIQGMGGVTSEVVSKVITGNGADSNTKPSFVDTAITDKTLPKGEPMEAGSNMRMSTSNSLQDNLGGGNQKPRVNENTGPHIISAKVSPAVNDKTNPTKEQVIAAVKTKLEETLSDTDRSYYEGIIAKLEGEFKVSDLAEDDRLAALIAGILLENTSSTSSEMNFNWEETKTKLIAKINEKYIDDNKDGEQVNFWQYISDQLQNPKTDISALFETYEELFLLLSDKDVLPEFPRLSKVLTAKFGDVYTNFSKSDLYADLGTDNIYGHLSKLKDKKGQPISRGVYVSGKGTVFGVQEELTFKILNGDSSETLTEKQKGVNWLVFDADGNEIYRSIDEGVEFKHSFKEAGLYVVEAYGGSSSFKSGNKTLDDAKKSSKAGYKTTKRKSFMAIEIKRSELTKIITKPKGSHFRESTKIELVAAFDVGGERPDIQWVHYHREIGAKDYSSVELEGTGEKQEVTFDEKGWHYLEACTGQGKAKTTTRWGSAERPIAIGGNYITAMSQSKDLVLYSRACDITFKATKFALNATEKEKESVHWRVMHNKKEIANETGSSFTLKHTQTIPEGTYIISATTNDALFGKRKVVKTLKVIHPQVKNAFWGDSDGKVKLNSGYRNEDNFVYAQIPYFKEEEVCVAIQIENEEIHTYKSFTDNEGNLKQEICLDDMDLGAFFKKGKKERIMNAVITGANYSLKKPEDDVTRRLKNIQVHIDEKIVAAYFMFNGQIVSPVSHVVPYGSKLKAIVETVNMAGQTLEIDIYRAKEVTHYGDFKSKASSYSVEVNSDGLAVTDFVLDTAWEKDHDSKKYFYIGVEKVKGAWLSTEFDSKMLRAFKEGEKLDDSLTVINKIDAREARVRAFLRMLRVGEGTVGETGYETLFGGQSFIKDYTKDWKNHPGLVIKKNGYKSSAAGAYQVMQYTWNDPYMIKLRKKHGISSFSQENQDKFALILLKYKRTNKLPQKYVDKWGSRFKNAHGDMIQLIIDENIERAILVASLEWASLPGSPYGQPQKDYKEAIQLYKKYLKEELSGKSDLHLEEGFLKELGY